MLWFQVHCRVKYNLEMIFERKSLWVWKKAHLVGCFVAKLGCNGMKRVRFGSSLLTGGQYYTVCLPFYHTNKTHKHSFHTMNIHLNVCSSFSRGARQHNKQGCVKYWNEALVSLQLIIVSLNKTGYNLQDFELKLWMGKQMKKLLVCN